MLGILLNAGHFKHRANVGENEETRFTLVNILEKQKKDSKSSSNLGWLAYYAGSPFLAFLTKTVIGLYRHSSSLLSFLIPETRTDQHPSG